MRAAIEHALPADGERAFPLVSITLDERTAATNTGVVKQQVDVLGLMLLRHFIAKAQHILLLTDVTDDWSVSKRLAGQTSGFIHVFLGDIAHGHMGALGDELTDQFSSHAGTTPGDHSDFIIKFSILLPPFSQSFF